MSNRETELRAFGGRWEEVHVNFADTEEEYQ